MISTLSILGIVHAGFATPSEESLLGATTLDDYIVENREASFMLRIKGDSMKDAGIHDGDMVVVERTNEANPGQIVICELDGAWTIKYLRKKGSMFYLEAANENYQPMFPREDLRITAIVKAVIRKY